MQPTGPIGVFDSGVGGLTIAKAISARLPQENLIYFGDTAHLPYGDKSAATIQSYCHRITEYLLQAGCKVIVMACNSASSAAYAYIQAYVDGRAQVLNVIDPVVAYVHAQFNDKRVGLIGTKQTIHAGVYPQKLAALGYTAEVVSQATPLLVPIIEEGLSDHPIMTQALDIYLSQPAFSNVEALILGCTHYPLIHDKIHAYYEGKVTVIDARDLMADAVSQVLDTHKLHHPNGQGEKHFYVSDESAHFTRMSRLFFERIDKLECLPLWR